MTEVIVKYFDSNRGYNRTISFKLENLKDFYDNYDSLVRLDLIPIELVEKEITYDVTVRERET